MIRKDTSLDVAKILKDFQKAEAAPSHRKDAFKIEGNFKEAVRKITKGQT